MRPSATLVSFRNLILTHYQSSLERASVIAICWKEQDCGGGSGGGNQGGPVVSFTSDDLEPFFAATLCSSSCAYPQSHAVGTDQCAIFRIMATVIDYFHYLSLPVIDYLLITAWRLSSLERTSMLSYYSLESASIISIS